MIGYSDVLAARERISPHVTVTPLVMSSSGFHLKLESRQVTGSFKARGALNALMQLPPDGRLIVTASAGNHGRAIAWAAERLGFRAVVFTPRNAPQTKTKPILAHGAELRRDFDSYEHAEHSARRFAADNGAIFVSPYNHPDVIAGAGTTALELLEQQPDLDTLLVPIGGGGLISGVALAAKGVRPAVRIVGVECASSPAFTAALEAGRIVEITVRPTIADGLGGNVEPGTMTWPIIRQHVDEVVLVQEESILSAMRHLVHVEGVKAEGAGATAVAAVLDGTVNLAGRTAAALVTGGNIDEAKLAEVLG